MDAHTTAGVLLERHGHTYADEAGITLKDKPSPLFQLLVLTLLLSARISADIATAAARELWHAGFRTPQKMSNASWQDVVDALGRGHYRRYDESTATELGELAEKVLDQYGGDLRRLHERAENASELEAALQEFKGIGPTGASIFCREVQGIWADVAPYVDSRAADGAELLGLPRGAEKLAALVDGADLARLVAGCVRAAGDKAIVENVRAHTD